MITSIRVQQIAVQLLHSAWKRKTILLFVALLSTLLLFAGQLNMRSKRASARDTARTWQKALDPYSHVPAPSPLLFHAPEPVASYPSGRDSLDQTNLRPDTLRQIAQNEAPQSGNLAGLVTQSDGIVRQSEVSKYPSISSSSRFVPDRRIVHFDLKGAPPKIEYIKKLLPLLKKAGANGVLLEYEDMFPYEGNLSVIRAGNAFKKEQLIDLIREFVRHQFEVIPLVQTFGHLEFALKVKQFRRLREIDRFPTAICPSRNESFAQLIQLIIDQVVQLHREANHPIKYLHIGCDEVFHIAQCDRCRNTDRETLFINHVRKVASYVRKVHSLQPIIWDDMLRTMSDDKFPLLGNLVEIMVWTYIKDIYRFIPYMTWKSFGDSFDAVWGASAFKGAFGETLTVPNANMHLENNIGWLDALKEQKSNFHQIRGLVLTGWQRYDHLATLCELLPAAIPSLILNLITVTSGQFDPSAVWNKFNQVLDCSSNSFYQQHLERNRAAHAGDNTVTTSSYLESDPFLYQRASTCHFPGVEIFRLTKSLGELVKKVDAYVYDVNVHRAWLTDYNFRRNYTNPARVEEQIPDASDLLRQIEYLMSDTKDRMAEVYDMYTISEWIEQNIYPYLLKVKRIQEEANRVSLVRQWQVRPLTPLKDLQNLFSKP